MALLEIDIKLVCSYPDGRGIEADEFLQATTEPGELPVSIVAGRGPWMSALADFGYDTLAEIGSPTATEAFFAGIEQRCLRVASWIEARVEAITVLLGKGMTVQLLIGLQMNQDQVELTLPPQLLLACGKAGIAVYVISND